MRGSVEGGQRTDGVRPETLVFQQAHQERHEPGLAAADEQFQRAAHVIPAERRAADKAELLADDFWIAVGNA